MPNPEAEARLAALRAQETAIQEERQSIYRASLDAPEEEKFCPDWMARAMTRTHLFRTLEYPIQVHGIHHKDTKVLRPADERWVAVRPVGEQHGGKTYLGVMLGRMALSCGVWFRDGILEVEPAFHNPAIYVPDLHEVVMGSGSWWSEITTPDELSQISDLDIESVWYVRALKDLGSSR